MDSSTILTMLGLITAVLAITPKESKLDLSLRISKFDWLAITLSLISIHYIMYYPILNKLGFKYNFGTWKFGFNDNNTTYLIFLFLSLFLFFRFKFFKVNKSNVAKFSELLEQLIIKKKYDEASHLIEKHFKDIETIKDSTNFRNRLANIIKPQKYLDVRLDVDSKKFSLKFTHDKYALMLSNFIGVDENYKDMASAIVSRIFNNLGFVRFLAESRPYYFISLLTSKSLHNELPLKQFFNSLIDDAGPTHDRYLHKLIKSRSVEWLQARF